MIPIPAPNTWNPLSLATTTSPTVTPRQRSISTLSSPSTRQPSTRTTASVSPRRSTPLLRPPPPTTAKMAARPYPGSSSPPSAPLPTLRQHRRPSRKQTPSATSRKSIASTQPVVPLQRRVALTQARHLRNSMRLNTGSSTTRVARSQRRRQCDQLETSQSDAAAGHVDRRSASSFSLFL